jgi:alpha-glucosidase (family GH31 glycosyl hydrolase)
MEMGLFGVPLSGSPICGTYNSSLLTDNLSEVKEEQLCIRWYQMGMMLPFAHSMTKLNQRARSPVDWSLNTRRLVAGYIQQRYRLLPYFYSLFYQVKYKSHNHVGIILYDFVVFPLLQANTQGTPVVRPMWYQFPKDNETYTLNEQFMIGESLMVCPVMVQDDTETNTAITVYFPSGTWFVYQLPVGKGDFSHHRAL